MSSVITASGCVPLNMHGGSTAVNTAQNYRQGFIGAFLGASSSGPMSWRSGVLTSTYASNTQGDDLAAAPFGTAGQGILVAPGNVVISRGSANGPYIANFNATSTVNLDSADTVNPRIDVVYAYIVDDAIGDAGATNGGFLAVVNGTPASSPAVPAVPSGALALHQVYRATVASGGNVITAGNITDVRTATGMHGGVRVLLPGDSLATPGYSIGEQRLRYNATYGWMLDYWDSNNAIWRGTRSLILATPTLSTPGIPLNTSATLGTLSIADPGWPYHIKSGASYNWFQTSGNSPGKTQLALNVQMDSTTWGTNVVTSGFGANLTSSTDAAFSVAATDTSKSFAANGNTGAHTLYLLGQAAVGNISTVSFPSNRWAIELVPA